MKPQSHRTKLVPSSTPTPTGVKVKISNEFSWIVRDMYESLAKTDVECARRYLEMHRSK